MNSKRIPQLLKHSDLMLWAVIPRIPIQKNEQHALCSHTFLREGSGLSSNQGENKADCPFCSFKNVTGFQALF